MARRQPEQKSAPNTDSAAAPQQANSADFSALRAPRKRSAFSQALAAAKADLSELLPSIAKLPSLADMIVCGSHSKLCVMNGEIQSAVQKIDQVSIAVARISKRASSQAAEEEAKELRAAVRKIKADLLDKAERAQNLLDCISTCHDNSPLLTRLQETELVGEMRRHRAVFWQKVFELPFVQAEHFQALKRVITGELNPLSVVFSGKTVQPEGSLVAQQARRTVRAVAKVLGAREPHSLEVSERARVATLLLRTPPSPDSILKHFNRAQRLTAALETLETKLICYHGDLSAARSSATPDWQQFTELETELGARALEARANISVMESPLRPYMAIRNYIAVSNKRLVFSVVLRDQRKREHKDDLSQEGLIGLLRAVDRYDPQSQWKFSTYATWWIKQTSSRAYGDVARLVRVPIHNEQSLKSISNEMSQQPQHLSIDELARRTNIPRRDIETLLPHTRRLSSLSSSGRTDDGPRLIDDLADRSSLRPEEIAERQEHLETLSMILQHLKPREREVLERRFGLNHAQPLTLKEIGERLGLTRERIRQIEAKALQQLGLIAQAHNLSRISPQR